MNTDNKDKSIDTTDLPQKWERTTTQQPEEFIDSKPANSEKQDAADRAPAEVKRRDGQQETS